MQNGEDRSKADWNVAAPTAPAGQAGASGLATRFTGRARSAPKGTESRIGDDETHRRLQEARNRARHSTEEMVRKELGPEWVQE
jgi:hypothetical protein